MFGMSSVFRFGLMFGRLLGHKVIQFQFSAPPDLIYVDADGTPLANQSHRVAVGGGDLAHRSIHFVKLSDNEDEILVLKKARASDSVPDEVKIFAHLQDCGHAFIKLHGWWWGDERIDITGTSRREVFILQESFETSFEKYLEGIRRGSTNYPEIHLLLLKFARDLAAMHERGIAHRDVKSANFCLNHDLDRAAIIDFALSRQDVRDFGQDVRDFGLVCLEALETVHAIRKPGRTGKLRDWYGGRINNLLEDDECKELLANMIIDRNQTMKKVVASIEIICQSFRHRRGLATISSLQEASRHHESR